MPHSQTLFPESCAHFPQSTDLQTTYSSFEKNGTNHDPISTVAASNFTKPSTHPRSYPIPIPPQNKQINSIKIAHSFAKSPLFYSAIATPPDNPASAELDELFIQELNKLTKTFICLGKERAADIFDPDLDFSIDEAYQTLTRLLILHKAYLTDLLSFPQAWQTAIIANKFFADGLIDASREYLQQAAHAASNVSQVEVATKFLNYDEELRQQKIMLAYDCLLIQQLLPNPTLKKLLDEIENDNLKLELILRNRNNDSYYVSIFEFLINAMEKRYQLQKYIEHNSSYSLRNTIEFCRHKLQIFAENLAKVSTTLSANATEQIDVSYSR